MEQAYVFHDLQKPECHYQRDSAEGCSGIRIVAATDRAGKHLTISDQTLHPHSTRLNGTQTLQFSFATKLRHMLKPQLPIYDVRVARFFLFQDPSTQWPLRQRINGLIVFHNFLIREYARVIGSGQLATAIDAFRQQLNPQLHGNVKIIDWLIWKFVELADSGQINW